MTNSDIISIKELLEEKHDEFNCPSFIENDPVMIPHQFSNRENKEISGFLTATIAWGQRPTILKSAMRMVRLMGNNPLDFILHHESHHLDNIFFKHRTFNETDLRYFFLSLQNIYKNHDGLKGIFEKHFREQEDIRQAIIFFRAAFFELPHPGRTCKHVANIQKNASAKRINMFLRWMVRKDERGVDFGLWDIPASALYIPLDIHSGTMARNLDLLHRKQNDWKAVEELTNTLRAMDAKDPVKYDFALFGMGVNRHSR